MTPLLGRLVLGCLMTTGAAIAVLGLAPGALAQSSANEIEPVAFSGTPTPDDIIRVCNLPRVVDPNSPHVETRSDLNPSAPSTRPIGAGMPFRIEVTIIQGTGQNPDRISFVDLSEESQFDDTPGIEAVSVEGSGGANIYCNIGTIEDSDLRPPGNNATSVSFFWVLGPCGLPGDDALDNVCAEYNPNPGDISADIVQAILDEPEQPINLCGCTTPVFFCNPDPAFAENDNIVSCPFSGATGLQGEAFISGASPACKNIGGFNVCGF